MGRWDSVDEGSERTLKEAAWATLPAAALTGCDIVACGGVESGECRWPWKLEVPPTVMRLCLGGCSSKLGS